MSRNIQAITFDLDNTLWNVDPVIIAAEQKLQSFLQEHCAAVTQKYEFEQLRALKLEVIEQQPELIHQVSKLRKQVLKTAFERSGYETNDAQAWSEKAFNVFLEARQNVTYYDHALHVLGLLKNHYVLGAITNGNADVRKLGLDQYFSFAFNAEEIGRQKPAPDIFNAALSHTQLTPRNVIHVGDHPKDDIWGAHQVGFATIWVNLKNITWTRDDFKPDQIISCLSELPSAIKAIASE